MREAERNRPHRVIPLMRNRSGEVVPTRRHHRMAPYGRRQEPIRSHEFSLAGGLCYGIGAPVMLAEAVPKLPWLVVTGFVVLL